MGEGRIADAGEAPTAARTRWIGFATLAEVKQTEQEILALRTRAWERPSVFSTYVIAGGSLVLVLFIFISANLTSRDLPRPQLFSRG